MEESNIKLKQRDDGGRVGELRRTLSGHGRSSKNKKIQARGEIIIKRAVHTKCQEALISTIMVVGGLGDYFDVTDKALLMDCYCCQDDMDRAKEIVTVSDSRSIPSESFGMIRNSFPVKRLYSPDGKVKTLRRGLISYG